MPPIKLRSHYVNAMLCAAVSERRDAGRLDLVNVGELRVEMPEGVKLYPCSLELFLSVVFVEKRPVVLKVRTLLVDRAGNVDSIEDQRPIEVSPGDAARWRSLPLTLKLTPLRALLCVEVNGEVIAAFEVCGVPSAPGASA